MCLLLTANSLPSILCPGTTDVLIIFVSLKECLAFLLGWLTLFKILLLQLLKVAFILMLVLPSYINGVLSVPKFVLNFIYFSAQGRVAAYTIGFFLPWWNENASKIIHWSGENWTVKGESRFPRYLQDLWPSLDINTIIRACIFHSWPIMTTKNETACQDPDCMIPPSSRNFSKAWNKLAPNT